MAKRNKNNRRRDRGVATTQPVPGAVSTFKMTGVAYSGPFPPPDMLAGFEAVLPGAAERIVAMAERQETHRQTLEVKHQASQTRRAWGGLIAGFVLAAGFLYASYQLIVLGYGVYGVFLGGGIIVSLVTVFVIGTTSQRNERQSRVDKLLGRNQ